jgi:hypothetical protein
LILSATTDGSPSNFPSSHTSSSNSNGYTDKGQIAAGIIGILLIFTIIGGFVWCLRRGGMSRRTNNVGDGEQNGGKRWPMPRVGLGSKAFGFGRGRKGNGDGEEWKSGGGKWEELR